MMIDLIVPAPPEPAKPVERPKPLPVVRHAAVSKQIEAPILTVPAAVDQPPPASAAPAVPPRSVSAQVTAPELAPITAPVFNADYLHNPAPEYPPESRRRGEQGIVVLRVHVSPAGLADQVEVQSSSGSSRLDQVAVTAVRTWQFVPAHQGDKPVAAWVAVPLHFKLGG